MMMDSCIPLPLDTKELEEIVQKAKDWALLHGVGMRSRNNFSLDGMDFAPFLLLPSTFPKSEFLKSKNVQHLLNILVHKVAHDFEFLTMTLSKTIEVDEFTRRLFNILEIVQKEGITQVISLGLLRSDYFLDESQTSGNNWGLKQVEINTIASSFGALSTFLVDLHRYILSEIGHDDKLDNLPDNLALEGLCRGMLKAWELYQRPKSVILFVIEPVTYNFCDQRFHEYEIRKQNPKVHVIRRTLEHIGRHGSLDDEKRLYIDGFEVAVIYFRSGYSPNDYTDEIHWESRLLMERSLAIKCPSIYYHLAGTKKVQQELSRPGVLERFVNSKEDLEAIREIFTGLYSLDKDESGDKIVEMAIANPSKFVLKPQREGGGNNIYNEEIAEFLQKIKDNSERNAWILMDKINPPPQKNYMIRPGLPEPVYTDFVSELGIFGVVIGDEHNIIVNEQVGHMLRTKVSSSNEAGVAAGFGALDSIYLVD